MASRGIAVTRPAVSQVARLAGMRLIPIAPRRQRAVSHQTVRRRRMTKMRLGMMRRMNISKRQVNTSQSSTVMSILFNTLSWISNTTRFPKTPSLWMDHVAQKGCSPSPPSSSLLSTLMSKKDKSALELIITRHQESANRLESPKASPHHVITRYAVRHNASQSRLSSLILPCQHEPLSPAPSGLQTSSR